MSSHSISECPLIVYPGLPHGMCSIDKHQINADLLAFLNA
jgi:hypothetical protein